MKRIITAAGAFALAGGLFFIGADARAADPTCGDDTVSVPIPIGVVCAGGDAEAQQGHVYADGNEGNDDPADGYIGVGNDGGDENESGVVGCADGNYSDDADGDGDADPNSIWDPASGQPPEQPDPTSPCSPGTEP